MHKYEVTYMEKDSINPITQIFTADFVSDIFQQIIEIDNEYIIVAIENISFFYEG